jgi:hypothetical protein
VEELLSRALREIADRTLRNSILEVGVDATKGELLALGVACLSKKAVREASIIAVVMGDADPMLGCEAFEGVLRVESFLAGEVRRHEVHELEAREVIDEDGSVLVSGLGEYALRLAIESWLGGLHMVHRDALPRLGGAEDRVSCVALSFRSPRNLCHGPIEAAGTARRADTSETRRDFAIGSHGLQSREGLVAEAVMPTHQLGLIVGSRHAIFILLRERRRRIVAEGVPSLDGAWCDCRGRRRR